MDTDTEFKPHVNAWPRTTVLAGYILSFEQRRTRCATTQPASSPTVLYIIDEDFRKQGGIGVFFNVGDSLNENTSTRYLVATQAKRGNWWNTSRESVERERVTDPEIRLEEGEEDRRVLERNGGIVVMWL